MSLDYKIFWIDDDDDLPDSIREQLEIEYDEVFKFDIEVEGDGTNLELKMASEPIDLLILDWNINGDRDGLQLIDQLLISGELTEIIFYSQDERITENCREVMGVHTCVKGEADEKIKSVISRFHERSKNVAIMRGMIISEAIDLENKLTDIILALFGNKSDLFRKRILNKPILDFGKKHSLLNGLLKDKLADLKAVEAPDEEKIQKITNIKEVFNQMMREVVNQRNILAHSKKKFEDGVLVLDSINNDPPIHFTDEWKNEIRSNIKKHLTNLVAIKAVLTEEGLIDVG